MNRTLVLGAGLAVGAAVAGHLLLRPRMMQWGATKAEARAAMAGEDLLDPSAQRTSTMACTLPASPADVWPWLEQMGCDRAGFYSWDRLDNGGQPSARSLLGVEPLQAGDRVSASPDGSFWFEVALVQPPHTLVLRSTLDEQFHPYDPAASRPAEWADSLWIFRLAGLPGGRSRLVVRTSGATSAHHPFRLVAPFGDLAHWVMQTRQFHGLAERVGR